jgi:enoyl-CoA hydratase
MSEPVVLWEDRDAVALVTINRPKVLNALNAEVMESLIALLRERGARPGLRAIVITGAGDRSFVAGADIAGMASFTAEQAERFAAMGHTLGLTIEALPVPVIAAVQGFCLGGGCELALACDFILAGPKARFGQPEVRLGVIPGFGGTQRLARRCGSALALDLCLTGRQIGADEALRIGLVSRVVEGDVVEAALAAATEIAANSPFAVRMVRRAILENVDADLDVGLAAERSLFALCFASPEQAEGMAAFLGKRPPSWAQ